MHRQIRVRVTTKLEDDMVLSRVYEHITVQWARSDVSPRRNRFILHGLPPNALAAWDDGLVLGFPVESVDVEIRLPKHFAEVSSRFIAIRQHLENDIADERRQLDPRRRRRDRERTEFLNSIDVPGTTRARYEDTLDAPNLFFDISTSELTVNKEIFPTLHVLLAHIAEPAQAREEEREQADSSVSNAPSLFPLEHDLEESANIWESGPGKDRQR